jgi:formaldehyde-activating enzyme involved in methanogenesis
MTKMWKWGSILGSVALAVAVVGAWLFGSTSVASASEMTATDLQTLTQSTSRPGLFGDGYLAQGDWGRGGFWRGDDTIDYQQLLADALGITVGELQDAFKQARATALEQAVEQGLITQEQADEIIVWDDKGFGSRALGRFGGPKGLGPKDRGAVPGGAIDGNALLAEALGISVKELQAAREEANQAALEQALAEGIITQEQADQMAVRKDLQSYLDRNALLAEALGMTAEELQAAFAEGKTLSDLLGETGLDAATVRENMQAAFEAAIAQAVEDGVITQEQADALPSGERTFGPRGFGPGKGFPGAKGFPGGRGFRGRGGSEGQCPCPCPSDTDDTSGARFGRPGRFTQDSSAL